MFKECFGGCLKCISSTKCSECDSKNGFLYIKLKDFDIKDRNKNNFFTHFNLKLYWNV
jgi:hypothetical protein